jgi:serine phosphatase RsbU (regulator of sigma subunit)
MDFDQINWTVYAYVNSLLDASAFGIGLYNREARTIEFINFLENGISIPNFKHHLSEGGALSVACFRNQREIVIGDLQNEYKNFMKDAPSIKTDIQPQSAIFLPLMADKPLGVITVQSPDKHVYSDKEVTLMKTLASYISIALSNARAYDEISRKNESITDSIRYALTIQRAILPDPQILDKTFEERFVIFKPKDIVSGDYYWFSKVNAGPSHPNLDPMIQEISFIAAVDCTGHGVPGAFMSMISNTLLNEIVNVQHIYEPAHILEELHKGIIKALRQEDNANDDGMDVCLCAVEKHIDGRSKVTFTGAKRPLYYLPNGSTRLMELRGDNKSIGGMNSRKNKPFTNQELYLDRGSLLYLATDGIADQNNKDRKKFGTTKLKHLIQANVHRPLKIQQEILEKALSDHQEGVEQRDDITLLGIKI